MLQGSFRWADTGLVMDLISKDPTKLRDHFFDSVCNETFFGRKPISDLEDMKVRLWWRWCCMEGTESSPFVVGNSRSWCPSDDSNGDRPVAEVTQQKLASSSWFTHSVWHLLWGWKTDLAAIAEQCCFYTCEVNQGQQSKIMSKGMSYSQSTWSVSKWAVFLSLKKHL